MFMIEGGLDARGTILKNSQTSFLFCIKYMVDDLINTILLKQVQQFSSVILF